ncbi:MAG: HlyD family efflux transporter periplasmic adaptor subunit [Noviherbaspirillum sp.]
MSFLSRHPDTVLALHAVLLSHSRLELAAADLATRLAGIAGVDRVAIGLVEGSEARVIALSNGVTIDARQDLAALLVSAMDEAIDQAASIAYPQAAGQPRVIAAHAVLAGRHGGSVFTVPLAVAERMTGAVTFEQHGEARPDALSLADCETLLQSLAPLLLLRRDGERSLAAHAGAAAKGTLLRIRLKTGPGRALAATLGLGALVACFLLPVSYDVTAPVRLEGAVQRALTAPDDGYLQQVNVRPGDAVKAGQVLAELGQQDLQLDRSKIESELAQHESGYGTALAQADRSMLVAYQARADQARSRLDLISRQIARARISAPFDGVVLSGDLSQSLGTPVQRGSPLMVVAPLDRYRLIVEVDEREIADVRNGAPGRITLTVLPEQTFRFSTERIAPVAITRDGRHFFEVEGKLDSGSSVIRPGLEGIARIAAPARPLASALGHRLRTWLRMSLWSLGWW